MACRRVSQRLISFILAGILTLMSGAMIAATSEGTAIKPANSCRPLNLVEKDGEWYRQAIDAIKPLVRNDGKVSPSSCSTLFEKVQNPGEDILVNLPAYQAVLNEFFSNFCHRDEANGWRHDIRLRDTGPFIQQATDNGWVGKEYGTHNAVVIWYSPGMYEFTQKRSAGDSSFVMPEGAMAVKEMFTPPASDCSHEDPIHFKPIANGVAFFVRHSEVSLDGWYWGYYGWSVIPEQVDDLDDKRAVDQYFADLAKNLAVNQSWQPAHGIPGTARVTFGAGTGWGPGCLDCHASASSYKTFADLKNITGGSPDDPINTYLSMNFPTAADPAVPKHLTDAKARLPAPTKVPDHAYNPAFLETFDPRGIFSGNGAPPSNDSVKPMRSASFDTVWVKADKAHGRANVGSQYITSDQCFGCHDVGQTGLMYDMSSIDKKLGKFIDQAPFGTWRTSPMGLAGRDPIFFAQLASETQTFHSSGDTPALVENVCLGCHGIQGQRQYNLDHALANDGNCGEFTRDMVNDIPVADGDMPPGEHSNYGALARDGISCTSCHHAIFKRENIAGHFENGTPDAQNKCVLERQQFINPGVGHSTLAATFTGSFMVGDPDSIAAPFEEPKVKPMQNALGLTPVEDDTFTKSDVCGSCHSVHLPILHDGKNVGTVFEQTTYPEWAFSDFRTGVTANYPHGNGTLPSGEPNRGKLAVSCQRCHMESSEFKPREGYPEGLVFPDLEPDAQFVSKIATIQEKTNFPASDNTLPADDIDLERRQGFARHTLVGLNVFFISMAKQYPGILGIPKNMAGYLGSVRQNVITSLPYIDRTLYYMQNAAKNQTAKITVVSSQIQDDVLNARVKVTNGVGHKFPSGVGFRRAFVEFRVLDEQGSTLWGSGTTNGAGVILDNGADPDQGMPIEGELWRDQQCQAVSDRLAFQPHFDTGARAITRQDQAQIYQELVMAPPPGANIRPEVVGRQAEKNQPVDMCGTQLAHSDKKLDFYPGWRLTTSFLSICAQAKDNRLLPQGYLPLEDRLAISKMFTTNPDETAGENAESMALKLATESGSWGVGDDPDYVSANSKPFGGSDSFDYAIPLADIKGKPASVSVSLFYQATPPFYLQDRFCTATGDDRDRLYFLAGKIKLDELAADWKLPIASGKAELTRSP
jgi:hypothetical protein